MSIGVKLVQVEITIVMKLTPILLSLPLLLSSFVRVQADPHPCDGTQLDIRKCLDELVIKTDEQIQSQLSPAEYQRYEEATMKECEKANEHFKDGSIYPSLILRCFLESNESFLNR